MTRKQLEDIFTFPNGIDQFYVPRREAIQNTLYQLYEAAGLDIPKVYFFKSPLALQMALNYLTGKGKIHELDNDFRQEYPTFVHALLFDELNTRSRNRSLWEFVSQSVAAPGAAHIEDPQGAIREFRRYNHLAGVIEGSVKDDLQKRLAIKRMEYYDMARHPHFSDIGWLLAHQKFLNKLPDESRHLYLMYYDLVRNGIMHAWMLEGAVLWCPLPSVLRLNDLKQFHAKNGPALHWNDDYGLYFWNGTKVRRRIIEFPETITRLDVLEEHNPEIRKCIQERMGIRNFASLFKLVEMDRDLDLQGNEQYLWRTSHIDDLNRDHLYFAEVTSPTNQNRYFLEVPGGMNNVWEAVAWTFGNDTDNQRSPIEV